MCGIHAVISANNTVDEIPSDLKQSLRNRGPDYLGCTDRALAIGNCHVSLCFTSTVLALRGDHVAKQPFEDLDSGSVLCWNGEAWKIDGHVVDGNDGEAIFAKLASNSSSITDAVARQTHILSVLRSIAGPFAFLYYDAPGKCLYFGRDRLGRRSLLMKNGDSVVFSSVADALTPEWNEVEADGIYSISFHSSHLDGGRASFSKEISKDEWAPSGCAEMISSIGMFNMAVPQATMKSELSSAAVKQVRRHLTEALKLRVLNVPEPPGSDSGIDVRVAILFSGGLDCTVLARLAHELIPASQGIDLLNVAFENRRRGLTYQTKPPSVPSPETVYELCPDRITGRKAFAELQTACPTRAWRFIAVNVPYEEAMAHRPRVISLIYPHNTEMDLSIALALYFAARGLGVASAAGAAHEPPPPSVHTPARVLLSGLGADELFGGYGRHAKAFERQGHRGLIDELKLDIGRIAQRNLGRDDRVLAHWSKEVRFPYLDEDFVKFAIGCPVWEKCDFENKDHSTGIEPAKRVLRVLADELNLPSIAREKKRAANSIWFTDSKTWAAWG